MAKTSVPFPFVLENLSRLDFTVKAFFGCHAVYHGNVMLLAMRQKKEHPRDNGVWIATSHEHHEHLQKIFPSMRSIEVLGNGPSNWQNLPLDADDFESAVNKACELILKNDPRIGRVPAKKSARKKK